jgi:nucleoside-diphosphate-sugar epimerase
MSLLVTGASGQLGRGICNQLASAFGTVFEISRSGRTSIDGAIMIRATLGSSDLTTRVNEVVGAHPVQHVLHLAADINASSDLDDWDGLLSTNVIGTAQLLTWSVAKRVRSFSFASTYLHLDRREQPFTAHSRLAPVSAYAATKALNEAQVTTLCEKNGIRPLTYRIPSFYGRHAFQRWTVLPAMIRSALCDGVIRVFGTGAREMNFVHTDDIVSACVRGFESEAAGVMHLASTRSVTMTQLAEIIAACVPGSRMDFVDQPDGDDGRLFRVDIGETRERLGWQPRIDIAAGIADAVAAVRAVLAT